MGSLDVVVKSLVETQSKRTKFEKRSQYFLPTSTILPVPIADSCPIPTSSHSKSASFAIGLPCPIGGLTFIIRLGDFRQAGHIISATGEIVNSGPTLSGTVLDYNLPVTQ
jgi:hypothetical protein